MGFLQVQNRKQYFLQHKLWVIPLLVGFFLFVKTLDYGFVWDDLVVIENQMVAFQGLGDAIIQQKGIYGLGDRSYRPMVYVSYILDQSVWKTDPWGFHLSNLGFHLINTLLIYFLGLRLLRGDPMRYWVAFWSALFFTVHPGHVESVAWISGRADLLSLLFILLSFLFFLSFSERGSVFFLSGSALFYLFSILSKESTLFFVFLFPLLLHWRSPTPASVKRQIVSLSFFAVAGVIWLILRWVVLGDVLVEGSFQWPSFSSFFLNGFFASGYYLFLLFWPYPLSAFPKLSHSFSMGLPALLGVIITLGIIFRFWIKGNGKNPLIILSWWWLSLAPVVLIAATYSHAPLAERYFYIPSVGGILLVILVLGRWAKKIERARLFSLVLLIPLLLMMLQSFTRAEVWRDDLRFWRSSIGDIPNQWGGHQNLALALSRQGDFEGAEKEFKVALKLTEHKVRIQQTLTSLGIDALKQKEYEAAEGYLTEALRHDEKSTFLHYNLGVLYQKGTESLGTASDQEGLRKALGHFEKAVEYDPFYIQALLAAGSLKRVLRDEEGARKDLQRVIELSHASGEYVPLARRQLAVLDFYKGISLARRGETKRAVILYQKALELDPRFSEVHYELAIALVIRGSLDEALKHLQWAVRERSDFSEAHFKLGELLTKKKDFKGAVMSYRVFLQHWKGDTKIAEGVRSEIRSLEVKMGTR